MPDENEVVTDNQPDPNSPAPAVQPETKEQVPLLEPSTATEGPGAPIPVSGGDSFVTLRNPDYNAAIAEHGNIRNFCKNVHEKHLVDVQQMDGFAILITGPLPEE